jgi:hypothetical protein
MSTAWKAYLGDVAGGCNGKPCEPSQRTEGDWLQWIFRVRTIPPPIPMKFEVQDL